MKKQYSKSKDTCKVTFSLPAEATTGASSVTLLGDFNEWKEEAGIPLKPQKDGSYKTQLELSMGQKYEFRYLVDGYRWENDYSADQYVPSPYPGIDNCVVEIETRAPKAASKTKKDDLRKIEGIGPKIAGLLKEEGVVTFKDLSATSVEKLKEVLVKAGPRFKMHSPLTWPQQAQMAADGKWDELKKLQDELVGGR
ncbi:MAG: helix-hairpin-helix domain-containing protein [Bacteroidota bacterium]